MNQSKSKTRTLSFVTRFIMLLASTAIVLYLFPSEGKFKYDYVKGSPWDYELLIATFDFPVHKTGKEIEAEKDSALVKYAPYYDINAKQSENILIQISDRFNSEFGTYAKENSISDTLQQAALSQLITITNTTLSQGIISFSEKSRLTITNTKSVVIVNKDYAQKSLLVNINDPRAAYEKIMSDIENTSNLPFLYNFINELDLNNYIKSNLASNKELSQKEKNELIQNISETSGMIMTGERIVDRGQIVSGDTYKILESYKTEYEKRVGTDQNRLVLLAGQLILVFFLLFALLLFLYLYRPSIYNDYKSLIFVYLNVILFVFIVSMMQNLPTWTYYLVPIAIVPITLRTFFDSRVAIFVNTVTILLVSFMVPNGFEFLLLQFSAGIAGTFGLRTLYKRDQLVRVAGIVVIVYSIIFFSLSLIQEGQISTIEWQTFGWFGINGLLLLFTYPLVYLEEKAFGYVSDVTLMELSNTNSPLLRRLAEKAPGTFQHSTIVANLCQEAATLIDANPLLVRAGAFYHDIGKSVEPIYFTENQTQHHNPHKQLNEKESAKVIIDHVYEGVKLAKKYRLPDQITDFILSHHGKGKAKYFYIKYKEKNPDEELNDADFSYPGPSPFSKEMAILMMADAIEASSRSLSDYTEESISNLVEKIIEGQLADGQFRNAPITFQDIETVKQCFKDKLQNIYHTRIAYPEEKPVKKEN